MTTLGDAGALVAAAVPLAKLAYDVISGREKSPATIAKRALGVAVDMVPIEELRGYLTDEARLREDLAFEAAKLAKLGREG